ncbi:MAG: hypothetical protein PHY48_13985 [Candidatus Cloacimonetes bacterium]|nr:hypothetical protein [Candidatus Cloacimonadota bacterium]
MYSQSRSIPLIITLPDDANIDTNFFQEKLAEDSRGYLDAQQIAQALAKTPSCMSDFFTHILVAVGPTDVIISHNQEELEQWADQYSEGEVYWFFSLLRGEALPLKRKEGSFLNSPAFVPNDQIYLSRKRIAPTIAEGRKESIDSSCEAPEVEDAASPSYRAKLEVELYQCTDALKVLLNKYKEYLFQGCISPSEATANMLLGKEGAVINTLFEERSVTHVEKLAALLTAAYHCSFGL